MVVRCERYGLFVMLDESCVEGILPVRALGTEWYVYDEKRMRLIGESTGRTWSVGKRVAVAVADVDIAKGRIEFSL
jgi:ribonuclease R